MQRAIISPEREPRRETVAVEIDLIAGLKAPEGRVEIEVGIGEVGPARQCLAVLDLLLAPAARAVR